MRPRLQSLGGSGGPRGVGPQAKGLSALCPVVRVSGPTWGCVWAHSARRALQRGQPAPHAADALGEACLLGLEQLLQLADGREELLLVHTVLGRETSPHTHSGCSEATQTPGPNRQHEHGFGDGPLPRAPAGCHVGSMAPTTYLIAPVPPPWKQNLHVQGTEQNG